MVPSYCGCGRNVWTELYTASGSRFAGGAHTDWQTTMEMVGAAVSDAIAELADIPAAELPGKRADKFISMTRDVEIYAPEHKEDE